MDCEIAIRTAIMGLVARNLCARDQGVYSRFFSSSVIRELGRRGQSPIFALLANELVESGKLSVCGSVGEVFESAFNSLKKKQNRNEYIYKTALTHKVLLGTHSLNTAVMLNEFRVCDNKADMVILNGTSTVYEIKSERDSLSRLNNQVSSYRKVFANVNIITGENHLEKALGILPEEIGVMVLTNRYQISTIRYAQDLTDQLCTEDIFNSLQLREVKGVLKELGIESPNLPNTRMHRVLKGLFLTLTPKEAHDGMVKVLRKTRSKGCLNEYISLMPSSISHAVLSTPLRKQDYPRLIDAVQTPIKDALSWR